jgi:hypothetical protein
MTSTPLQLMETSSMENAAPNLRRVHARDKARRGPQHEFSVQTTASPHP